MENNEALERCKQWVAGTSGLAPEASPKEVAEYIFPELAESEDERIRKGLLNIFKESQNGHWAGMEIKDIVAWLEKQKEQKKSKSYRETMFDIARSEMRKDQQSAEWSEEDEEAFGDLMWCIEQARKSAKDENDMGNIWFAETWAKNRIKFLRPQPKQEWSEEDEKARKEIYDLLVNACEADRKFPRLLAWLKSLRPSWKPSEEQMGWLESAVKLSTDKPHIHGIIISLYEQLKKL